MLCLSENDLIQAASRGEIVNEVEKSLRIYEEKRFAMPDRMHIDHSGNTLLLMPCFSPDGIGTKLVTLFPGNADKGLSVLNGVMILNDRETGRPLALLNGSALTALRTGAVGAAGIKYTAPRNVKTLGVIGAGVQGYTQAVTACTQRDFIRIQLYDTVPEKSEELKNKLDADLDGIEVRIAPSSKELVEKSEVVVAATPSNEPVIPDDSGLTAGRHFVGIGSYKPEMREFPRSVFVQVKQIYVDTGSASKESGDIIIPLKKGWVHPDQVVTLGRCITGELPQPAPDETTLFKSVGMALFDLTVSVFLYRRAREKGLGKEIPL